MSSRSLGRLAPYAVVLSLAGCAPPAGPASPGAPTLHVRFLTGEIGCGLPAHDPTPPGLPPSDAATLTLEVVDAEGVVLAEASARVDAAARCVDAAGRAFSCPFVGSDDEGRRARQLTLADLPSDRALSLRAKVLDTAGIVRWSGRRRGVVLEADGQALVRLNMTRHASSTCMGRMGDGRAFGTATPLPDGRVLLAGGFSTIEECGPLCVRLGASSSADIFDPSTGLITPVQGGLSASRGLHSAIALADGRVVLVGGTDQATLDLSAGAHAPLTFPEPEGESGPRATFEVFDLASDTFAARGLLREARVAPALALQGDGSVLATGGGVRLGDGPAPTAEGLKTTDRIVADAEGGIAPDATPGPSPRSPRRGAALMHLPGAGMEGPWLLAGGAGDADLPWELLRDGAFVDPAAGAWAAHDATRIPNLYAPALVDLGDGGRLLVAGGVVAEALAFERRWTLSWRVRTEVAVVSVADGAAVIGEGWALLSGGLVGGPDTPVATDSTLLVGVDAATEAGPRLAEARAGHASVALPDGTVLVAGGMSLPSSDRLPEVRDSVELLNAGDRP